MSEHRIRRAPSPSIPGISDSVRVSAGDLVFISGAVGMAPRGSAAGNFADETDRCFAELARALADAGATFSDVVKLTIYVVDLDSEKVGQYRAVRDRWIDLDNLPASTLVGVSSLFSETVSIEIEAVAAV